jgi:hypothetical protein
VVEFLPRTSNGSIPTTKNSQVIFEFDHCNVFKPMLGSTDSDLFYIATHMDTSIYLVLYFA